MYIGHNVKTIRHEKKLKQEYVALKAKMSKTKFNRIENNVRDASDEDITALETALDVSRENLTKHSSGANFHNTNGKNYVNQQQNFADKEVIGHLHEEIQILRQREDKLLSMIADMNSTINELLKKIPTEHR
jgi:transcriptional regulator with XRE-family HTH domain